MKTLPALTIAALLAATPLAAQEILTADAFFKSVSANYAAIKDYEAQVTVTAGMQVMSGSVIYSAPTLLRMDFSDPESQVIVYDGQSLVVYIPELRAVLTQQTSTTTPAAAATGDGLRMLGRNYSIAYESGPSPVPLPEAETEQVVRLVLSRITVAEGFRTITLSIDPDRLLIRRMDGVTLAGDSIRYDFRSIRLNQGIPATRFIYDSPASANKYNNFLFSSDS